MDLVQKVCDATVTTRGSSKRCGKSVPAPTIFALHTTSYEVDLCEQHVREFEAVLEPYLSVGRATRKVRNTTLNGRALMRGKKGTFTTKDVRNWLMANGYEVSESGRISNELIEEYRAANT